MALRITGTPGPRAGAELRGSGATDLREPRLEQGEGGCGSRSWTLPLPVTALLNANQRPHWTVRHRVTKEIREAAAWTAKAAKVPPLMKAHVVCEVRFANHIKRDAGNYAPSSKAAVDGLVDAGVLPDDDALHLVGPDMRLGPVDKAVPSKGRYGRLVLHIYGIDDGDGGTAA